MRAFNLFAALIVCLWSFSASARRAPRRHPAPTADMKPGPYGSVRVFTFTAGHGAARARHEPMTSVTISCEVGYRPLWLTTTTNQHTIEQFSCVPLEAVVDTTTGSCTAKGDECQVAAVVVDSRGGKHSFSRYAVGTFSHPLGASPRCLASEEIDPTLRIVFPGDPERAKQLAPLPSQPGAINCLPRLVNDHYERTILFEGTLKEVRVQ